MLGLGQLIVAVVPCHAWNKELNKCLQTSVLQKKKGKTLHVSEASNRSQLSRRLLRRVRSEAQWRHVQSNWVLFQSLQRARRLLTFYMDTLKVGLSEVEIARGERESEELACP